MLPFPDAYPTILRPDDVMDAAFNEAMNGLSGDEQDVVRLLPITIAHVRRFTGGYPCGGQFQQEENYAASLLKVAVMYAACELHRFVTTAALAPGTPSDVPPDQFFDALANEFNATILSEVPRISNQQGISTEDVVPAYEKIFAVHQDPLVPVKIVQFHPVFAQHLRTMLFDPSALDSAVFLIQALGYGYINGALARGGFFRDPEPNGIWIAGDFGTRPDVRIPSVNDGDVAQATTTFDMANLYALMLEEILTGVGGFSPRMLEMLAFNANNGWFNNDPVIWDPARSNVLTTHVKIGEGPLKSGETVLSEGIVVHEGAHGSDFVVVYQDLRPATIPSLRVVAKLIEGTIDGFLARI
ncbi:hypothetical protein ACFWWA_30275 [Streptomyces goshikiensis]|uniref:hypothetical protein n=1 Tax=Streptomyces goshikiensis TaxID=1942 RepID=UPI003660BFB6